MTGAKGVIISIIGGEDMKLLEVDEAANHIRELVDPEANIIWGSAFNPDLDGKIRVSVVATGIEQSAEMAHSAASQPLSYGASRAPKKPVLPPPTEAELAEDAGASVPGQPARFGENDPYETPEADAYSAPPLPEAYADEGEEEADEDGLAEPADDSQFGSHEGGYASLGAMRIDRDAAAEGEAGDEWDEAGEAGEEAFELTDEAGQGADAPPPAGQDELLLDASRLIDADEPVQAAGGRRRRMLGGGAEEGEPEAAAPRSGGGGALAGSTLFERMANLSRANTGSDDDEEEEEEGGGSSSSLRIPRFLGRQNNQ
jgi:cell division protein FtsZ